MRLGTSANHGRCGYRRGCDLRHREGPLELHLQAEGTFSRRAREVCSSKVAIAVAVTGITVPSVLVIRADSSVAPHVFVGIRAVARPGFGGEVHAIIGGSQDQQGLVVADAGAGNGLAGHVSGIVSEAGFKNVKRARLGAGGVISWPVLRID